MPTMECYRIYAERGISTIITNKKVCTTNEGPIARNPCKGDSGGPLACKMAGQNKAAIVGIISNGIGCGLKEAPPIYIRVKKNILTGFYQRW